MKSMCHRIERRLNMSLPSWERGLKYQHISYNCSDRSSLPSWERGLKFCSAHVAKLIFVVAPFVGAWIEIKRILKQKKSLLVAPFVGAWIEINGKSYATKYVALSLPSWERGLKSMFYGSVLDADKVAPFVGAWIEIDRSFLSNTTFDVAPFVGAWIEICVQLNSTVLLPGRSLRGSVD